MSLIPEDKLKTSSKINLTPMIDFLFLMLAFFATLAVTRSTLFDTNLDLVHLQTQSSDKQVLPSTNQQINISVSKDGGYKWKTDIHDYSMENTNSIQKELIYQQKIGLIPNDTTKTEILLHIDKNAPWEPIAKLIYSIREVGFNALPVYEPKNQKLIVENEKLEELPPTDEFKR
jgi:biopolymer transport protein ExbD